MLQKTSISPIFLDFSYIGEIDVSYIGEIDVLRAANEPEACTKVSRVAPRHFASRVTETYAILAVFRALLLRIGSICMYMYIYVYNTPFLRYVGLFWCV